MSDAVEPHEPLREAEVESLLESLSGLTRVAVGVSGGPDSLSLLLMLAGWQEKHPDRQVVAFTVNHGLRAEAEDEAAYVAEVCQTLGVEHEVLYWAGPKPESGIQAAAREARKSLLVSAARAHQCNALILAHHRDDQAETFLQRLARGSGVYGLAAMRSRSEWEGLPVMRPLLGVPKTRLIATLKVAGLAWHEDRSNEDDRFTRVRLRKLLPVLEREGLSSERLCETAARLGGAAEALDLWVSRLLHEEAALHPAGPVRVRLKALVEAPTEIRYRSLSRLLSFVGGAPYASRFSQLERLADRLFASTDRQATLSGVILRRQDDVLFVWRELGREGIAPMEFAGPGNRVWDGRFLVEISGHSTVRVEALGTNGLKQRGLAPTEGWPRAAFQASPVFEYVAEGAAKDHFVVPGISARQPLPDVRFAFARPLVAASDGQSQRMGF